MEKESIHAPDKSSRLTSEIKELVNAITNHVVKAEYKTDAGKINGVLAIGGFIGMLLGRITAIVWVVGLIVCLIVLALTQESFINALRKKQ